MVAGFAWGTLAHAGDRWRYGAWPYRFGPPVLNVFWNTLVLLDAVTLALLLRRDRRVGAALAAIVMIADVAANAYAWRRRVGDGGAGAGSVSRLHPGLGTDRAALG